MSERNTDAEVERRVTEVHTLMVAGVRRAEIIRHGSNNGWDVSTRTIDNYMARATLEITSRATFDREHELGKAVSRLESLYRSAQQSGDHRTSLAIVKEYATLLGLNAAQKLELTGADGGALRIACEEWEKSIEAMMRKGGKL